MVVTNIDAILNELGWADGFRIPVANEENKQLEEKIEQKMKQKASLTMKLESVHERIQMVKKHTENLTVQRDLNQKLLAAHSAQLEAEDHLYRLSVSTESNLRQETRQFEKEWREVNQRVSNVEKELLNVTKKVENMKRTIKFDEGDLPKWEEVLNRKEEENQLIEQYMKEDANKYKEMEQKRQKLSIELESYRQATIRTIDEVHEMEIILDRTTGLYTQALKERRQMISQWTQSVAILRQRDNDIQKCLREIDTMREVVREKTKVLQETERFLKDQNEINKQLEGGIKQSEKKLFVLKEEHGKITNAIGMYESEVHIQKILMKNIEQKTEQMRADIKRKRYEIENKHIKVEDSKNRFNELQKTLEDIENQKINIQDKTKQLEKMMEQQEKRKSTMDKELHRLQAAILRTTGRITELESEKKILEMQRQNELKKVELLDTLQIKEEKILDEKKECLYHVEFSLQKCDMRLERIRGYERDKSEAERKQNKIKELQNNLSEKMEVSKLLQNQITSLEHDMKKISNSLTNDNNELQCLKNKKQDLVLLMEGGEKQLKAAQSHNEDKQVEESLLRLKVSQIENIMSTVGNDVYNLEKYQLQLAAALQERKAEIAVQNESLIAQKRVAANECSELRHAISERKRRIQQLQARYDNSIATFGTDTDGAAMTTAYLKIQTAQEKYLLQERGDKLDETIRKAEGEIQSMESTLRLVNACNDQYKSNLNTSDESGPEKEEQKKLDEEMHNVRETMKQKVATLEKLKENFQNMQSDYDRLLDSIEKTKEEKNNKERYLENLERQITEQKAKVLRADKTLQRVKKNIQNLCTCTGDRTLLIQEKEVDLRETQDQNALVLQDIAEFTIRHVEAEAYVKKLLATKNIELPSVAQLDQSPTTSRCESVTSSIGYQLKSTSRTSAFASSRESIGSVVNIEPQFEVSCISNVSKRDTKSKQPKNSSTINKHLSKKHQSSNKG
ncbi:hypothetical protein KM043_015649 [Ampulex compressa]|nr:hypothetical protein KM043_015649 [Ampulex compressa]